MNRRLSAFICGVGIAALLTAAAGAIDAGLVRVDTRLNVRTGAGTSYAVCDRLTKSTLVTLYETQSGFYRIGYGNDQTGYASAAYIQPRRAPEMRVHTGGGNLNIRTGAGTSYAVCDRLPNGAAVVKLDEGKNGFVHILYGGGKTGYASKAYLAAAPVETREAVTLSVPLYRQYDSRWKSLTLPGSGERLETHGCAVTSLAMVESFYAGGAVTPGDILESFAFTEGGAVYWTGYTLDDCSLVGIYAHLRRGTPVIYHARKESGSTHFVVVYGFRGGALSAENFLIRDPGAARGTLAAFLSVYGISIKTVHR